MEPVHLLWTSGWDSTFRLLDLIFVKGMTVQPYYLTDPDRPSTQIELGRMELILSTIAATDESAANLILPLVVIDRTTVLAYPEITDAYNRLRLSHHVGTQYEWLARFAEERGLSSLELSVEQNSQPHVILRENLRFQQDDTGDFHVLVADPDNPHLQLFRRFRFPLLNIGKLEMQEYAARHGFEQLLELTWFCHKPRNKQPCGNCAPCRQVIELGLGRRIPLSGRIRYFTHMPLHWGKLQLGALKHRISVRIRQ